MNDFLWQMWKTALKRTDTKKLKSNYSYIGINIILSNSYHFLNALHVQISIWFNHTHKFQLLKKSREKCYIRKVKWLIGIDYICLPIAALPQICTLRLVCSRWDLAFFIILRLASYLCWEATSSFFSSPSHGFHSSFPKATWSKKPQSVIYIERTDLQV